MSEWQPIDTAPKSGIFLAYLEEPICGSQMTVCMKRPNVTIVGGHFSYNMPKMTHWMVLPDPPKEDAL